MSEEAFKIEDWPTLDLSDGKRKTGLDDYYVRVLKKGKKEIQWYDSHMGAMRLGSWALRIGALVIGLVSAAIPLLAEITRENKVWGISPGWSAIGFLVVTALILIDQITGASTGWTRGLTAQMQLTGLLEELSCNYAIEQTSYKLPEPDLAETRHTLELLRTCISQINGVVQTETAGWATDYKAALAKLEEFSKTKAAIPSSGAVDVSVTNGAMCEGGWELRFGDRPPIKATGTTYSQADLPVGVLAVRVEGTIKGAGKVSAMKSVAVQAGAVAKVELSLT